jgi:integrase
MSYPERRSGKLSGWWYADVEHVQPNGTHVRYRRRFKQKDQAEGYEAYVKATGQEPPGLAEAPAGSFREIAEQFKARNPDWGRKDASAVLRLEWVIEHLGAVDIKTVNTSRLDQMVDKLMRTPGRNGARLSNRTINRYLDGAAVVLRYASRRDLIRMPEVPRLENKGNDRTETVSFDLEDAVCRWLEQHKDPRIAFVVRVFAETGMRRSELWKLAPEQVGNEALTLYKEQTKTGAARVVPLPSEMASKLRAMIAAGTLPQSYQVYRAFKEAAKACGASPELTLHSLRHTRVTRLIEAGVSDLLVAELVGHSSLQTTKRYAHPKHAALAEAANKVHQARGETTEKGTVVPFQTVTKTG